jgi:mercuric ion transport protein
MKTWTLGLLSALTASACCLGPGVLALLGLGSLGLGVTAGRYHRWFLGAALVLLAVAWQRFFREATRCRTTGCGMARGGLTGLALLIASLVVLFFARG